MSTTSITSRTTLGQRRQFRRLANDKAREGVNLALSQIPLEKQSLQRVIARGALLGSAITSTIVEKTRELSAEFPENKLESVMIAMFAYARYSVAKELLALLTPKLNEIEKRYVDEWGPVIEKHHLAHSMYMELGGCPEGRAERQAAKAAEEFAKEQLDKAGVTEERQKLLGNLVSITHLPTLAEYPPKELSHIRYRLKDDYRDGMMASFIELAGTLGAPRGFQKLLKKLSDCGEMLVKEEKIRMAQS